MTVACERAGKCRAPLCPRNDSVRGATWFPGQPTCQLRDGVPVWVETHRRVARVLKGTPAHDKVLYDACSLTVPLLEDLIKLAPPWLSIGNPKARTKNGRDS